MSIQNEYSNDKTLWEVNKVRNLKTEKFARQKWLFINSLNQGPYNSNAVQFTRPASADLIDYDSLHLSMPVSIVCSQQAPSGVTGTNVTPLSNSQLISMKPAGFLGLIDRAVIQINGVTCSNVNPYQSIYAYHKYLFNTSEDWHRSQGPVYGLGSELPFYEPLANNGKNLNSSGTTAIKLTCNQSIVPYGSGGIGGAAVGYAVPDQGFIGPNQGPYGANRCFWSRALNLSQVGSTSVAIGNAASPNVTTRCMSIVAIPFTAGTSAAGDLGVVITGYATIKLSMLYDIFRAIGLAQNVQFNLQLFMSSFYNAQIHTGGDYMTQAATSGSSINPVMVSTAGCTQASGAVPAGSLDAPAAFGNIASVALCCGCVNSCSGTAGSGSGDGPGVHTTTNGTFATANGAAPAELWWAQYDLTPEQQQEFLATPKTVLSYYDQIPCVQYQNGNKAPAGSTVTQVINGTLTAPKKLYLVGWPTATNMTNGTAGGVTGYTQCLSYEPYYSTYGAQINNIQVKVQQVPIFAQPELYSWQDFVANVKGNIGLNAALTPQISGTLMSKALWDNAKVWVWDLSRYVLDAMPVSVQVSFTNLNTWDMDCHYVVEQLYSAPLEITPSSYKLLTAPTESS